MKVRMAVGVCAMLLAAVVWAQAQESASEATPAAKPARLGRLTQPWNKIASLSDEQKLKIREIHGQAVAEINAIRQRETADIMALLSDEQKAEAERLMAEQRARRSASAAAPQPGDAAPAEEKKAE